MPLSCALLGGFAIGARVALLWQHNANRSYKLAFVSDIAVVVLKSDVKLQPTNKLASISLYDNIVRTRNVSEFFVLAVRLVVFCDGTHRYGIPAPFYFQKALDFLTSLRQRADIFMPGQLT